MARTRSQLAAVLWDAQADDLHASQTRAHGREGARATLGGSLSGRSLVLTQIQVRADELGTQVVKLLQGRDPTAKSAQHRAEERIARVGFFVAMSRAYQAGMPEEYVRIALELADRIQGQIFGTRTSPIVNQAGEPYRIGR